MGCGSWGKNSTDSNLNWRHFCNKVVIVNKINKKIQPKKIFSIIIGKNMVKNNGKNKGLFYKENDWPKLKKFIQNYWGKKHPFTKKKLFDWQFRGFEKKIKSIVLKNEKKIIGFRGLISGYYQIKDNHNLLKIVRGAESAIWTIDKKYRNKGLGKVMNDYILNKTDVFLEQDP